MDILISLAGKVAEYTLAPIGRQAGYILFYKGNLKELADHVKELEDVKERMSHQVEIERRNGKVIESDVANWLDEVNNVIDTANQFQEHPGHAKVGCSGWLFPNCISRHQLSRKATKIAKVVVQAQEKGKFDGGVAYLPALDGVTFSTSKGGGNLETRESFKADIVKALKDPNSRSIGVYGLGGLGKTTLMKEVAQIAKQDKLFDVVVMAHVSKTPDIKTIQGEIADQLGLQFQEETIAGREGRLRQRIKGEKTILVILDDMWTRLDLERVGISSCYEHNGCKLLMTSRNQEVLQQMDAQKNFTFRLELLSQTETWSLFQFMVGDVVKDITLQNIAIEVAERCAGLPLRIVTVARALKNKWDVKAWKDALRQLQSIDPSEMDAVTYNALELSYNSLESHEMKTLFLLFATMLGNNIEYFLKVSMGLDIFKHISTVDDARNRIYTIVESLKASCLLLESKTSDQIHMHDFVRDVAIFIAHRDHQVLFKGNEDELKHWPTNNFLTSCTQIILRKCHINKLPQRLECPNLKLFFLCSATRSLEIPDTIFEGMGNLSVLDLTNLNLSSLPTSFSSLTGLQTLCLEYCILENMDAIGGLVNLEVLSLRKSSMIKLPNEIGRLTKLRMLDLRCSGIDIIPPNMISNLNKLEELNMANASIKWDVGNLVEQNVNASLAELQNLSNLTALELQIHEAWIFPRDLQLIFEKLKRYKIAIGDVWEWSQIDSGTLKTLMLKLHTSLHLEHGIKALIKGVESLYLDEVDGIENVLYQLNGEGFPLLKNLHIQNNANMRHIIDTTKRNQVPTSFINLETLVLQNLRNLEQICHGPLVVNSFGKLRVIKVKDCVQLKYLLSFSVVKELSQLSEIEVCQCHSMKEIILEESSSSADNNIKNEAHMFRSLRSLTLENLQTLDSFFSYELMSSVTERKNPSSIACVSTPFFGDQVMSPKLDTLILSSLNIEKIWNGNQHSMNNLTNLIVKNCGELRYLLSSTMIESFKSLVRLEISKCHLMEEIVATEMRNNDTIALKEVQFSKLETIILKDMKNLKTIWHWQFDSVKTLQVVNCEKIVVVFPTSGQKTYGNLEKLEVKDCALVEEIFELTSSENSSIQNTTHLKEITLERLPKLKDIWSMDPEGILSFHNLEDVRVTACISLEYLFPFSVAICCSFLMELHIESCTRLRRIVAEKKESACTTPPIFQFDQLSVLFLWNVDELKGFYDGNHTLECPSLRTIDVFGYPKMNLFRTSSTSNLERFGDENLQISMKQPVFIIEEVIPNLERLRINGRDANMILEAQNVETLFTKMTFLGLSNFMNEDATFPYRFLPNVRSLEWLVIEWSSFEEIFQVERVVSEKIHTRLKKLILIQLPKLQHICDEGYRIDPVLELLEWLHVDECPSLKNLLPSSATFNHLTYLKITNCNGLINLITSSTARSLVKLTVMLVVDCNSLEEIIKGGENDDVDIAFTSLEVLKLECLPRLKKFTSTNCFLKFPLLEEVVLRECPRMKIFSKGNISAPNLRKVKIGKDNCEKWHWNGNLNDTVKNMFENKVAFFASEHLSLSEYPELKDLWYGQVHDKVFCNLKSLVVQRCDFLSHVLFTSNLLQVLHGLEEVEVRDCDSLEALFDVKGMKSEEKLIKRSSGLKRLTLSGLPKLKQIWNDDPYDIISFGNLCTVDVSMCQSLLYIFPLSICQDLGQLEKLEIEACGVEEIVAAMEEGSMKSSFNFPQLTKLRLISLINLKNFYHGKHTLECPSLKFLSVYRCEALKMFSFNNLDFQQADEVDKIQQALFSIDKLSPNLEQLSISGTDAMGILNGCRQKMIFHKVEFLQCFDETPSSFLKHFHAIFPNLVTFLVRNSSFETLFPTKGHLSMQISKQIKNLWLYELEKLKYIWEEDFPLDDPFLQQLEDLSVWNCPSLMSLVPRSTSFTNLTKLEVENCKKLVYLITSTTAKSLVQLTSLKIKDCEMILDVVKIIDEQEAKEEDIIFQNLEYLVFISMSSLRSFCNHEKHRFMFPSLTYLKVEGCPQMEIFSSGLTIAPYLTSIEVENKRKHWKGDLNTTIEQLFMEKGTLRLSPLNMNKFWNKNQYSMNNLTNLIVENCGELRYLLSSTMVECFKSLVRLEISKCHLMEEIVATEERNNDTIAMKEVQFSKLETIILKDMKALKTVWHWQFDAVKALQIVNCEKIVVVFPTSEQKTYGNLEKLEVKDCASVEEIFELSSSENSSIEDTTHLKEINLKGLLNLKKIWSTDPQGILNFHNLENVYLDKCGSLEYLFPLSIASCCSLLKELCIKNCVNLKEIIAKKKEFDCIAPIFLEFNQLSTLILWNLFKLKGFYAGSHTLTFPSLRTIDVSCCTKLNLYKTVSTSKPEASGDGKHPILIQQVFIVEEVIPNLEWLRINSRDADMILQAQNLDTLFTKVTFLGLSKYLNEDATFPYWFLQNMPILERLVVQHSSFEKIFQDERLVNEKICTRLKKLILGPLPKLQHICEEGYQGNPVLELLEWLDVDECPSLKNLLPSSATFNHLTYLKITNCNGLINLITSSTARSLVKLTVMLVVDCNSLEEIIKGGENDDVDIAFTSLEVLKLECLPRLKKFTSSNCFLKFPLLEEVVVRECPRMKIFSKGNISSPILRKVKIGKKFDEWHWNGNLNDTVKIMFEEKVAFCTSNHLSLSEYPELKDLWYGQLQDKVFYNLKSLMVQRCDFLSDVLFPSNILQVLHGLEEVEVRDCDSLEAVFDVKGMKKSKEIIEVKQSSGLKRLTLSGLPKLKQIWNDDPYDIISFKNLCSVDVSECQSLLYIFPFSICQDVGQLEKLDIESCGVEEIVAMVIPKLEKLRINGRDANMILEAQNVETLFTKMTFFGLSYFMNEDATFPYRFLPNVRSLEWLVIEWSSFEEIFQVERVVSEKIHTRLKKLTLFQLPKLQHICDEGYRIDPVLELLEWLHVDECPSLKNLLPSSATFNHLAYLMITNCNGLINLITSSTARSLAKLTTMTVKGCNSLEEIVKGDENADIAFTSLEILKLKCLPKLNKFCFSNLKFPLLEEVVVRECPRMKIFSKGNISAPILRKVKIGKNPEKWHWNGNLNDTVKNMFENKVAFFASEHLSLSEYPELKDLWYGQVHDKVFCNLKSLVVQRCDFLSHVLFTSNLLQVLHGLEEVEVRDCDSLEALFDVKGMKSEEKLIKRSSGLKRLTLSGLPKLKQIWNDDPYDIISFENLCSVDVSECQSLLYIFPLSICQDLGQLENLEIESCGVEEIVAAAMEEGSIMKCSFSFPQLTEFRLRKLLNLKNFYPGKHTLECPSLKILNVYCGEALRLFSFNDQVDEIHDTPFQQALFSIDKLSPNLDEISLSGSDVWRILNGCCGEMILHKVKFLRLQCFDETPAANFLKHFHAIFPSLVTLQVRNSSFETLFPSKGHLSMQISKQIRNLWLYELEKLNYIWEEDFPLDDPSLRDLECLSIAKCPSLISLVPLSTSFTNLTKLEVENCKKLAYLITSSTAKSLVQLTSLKIKDCEMMLDVVKIIDEQEAKEEIIFKNLEYLEFISMSSLRSFCYHGKHTFMFPSLTNLHVKECPQMEIFSSGVTIAPYLTTVEVENKRRCWKGDLNTTIQHLFIEKKEVSHPDDK